MRLKSYIWGMRLITLLSIAALGAVVCYVDPDDSGPTGLGIFYLVAFLSFSGIFNLFLLNLRRRFLGDEVAALSIDISFRQGMLLSMIASGILMLQGFRMLVWWDALLVVGGVFLVELYFVSKG